MKRFCLMLVALFSLCGSVLAQEDDGALPSDPTAPVVVPADDPATPPVVVETPATEGEQNEAPATSEMTNTPNAFSGTLALLAVFALMIVMGAEVRRRRRQTVKPFEVLPLS